MIIRATAIFSLVFFALGLSPTGQTSPGAGPVIVLETAKGNIEIETYPEEAPKTVEQIVALVKKNFYNGLRFHRAEAGIVQIGDPQTRNMLMKDYWGRAVNRSVRRKSRRSAVTFAGPWAWRIRERIRAQPTVSSSSTSSRIRSGTRNTPSSAR